MSRIFFRSQIPVNAAHRIVYLFKVILDSICFRWASKSWKHRLWHLGAFLHLPGLTKLNPNHSEGLPPLTLLERGEVRSVLVWIPIWHPIWLWYQPHNADRQSQLFELQFTSLKVASKLNLRRLVAKKYCRLLKRLLKDAVVQIGTLEVIKNYWKARGNLEQSEHLDIRRLLIRRCWRRLQRRKRHPLLETKERRLNAIKI